MVRKLGFLFFFLFTSILHAEVIVNGDFESIPIMTGPPGWSGIGSGAINGMGVYAHSGSFGAQIGGGTVSGIQQQISGLTIGNTYELSFYMTHNGLPINNQWWVSMSDNTVAIAGSTISLTGPGTFVANNNEGVISPGWNYNTLVYTATSTSFWITLLAENIDGGIYSFDDVELTATPEPGSLALMAITLGLSSRQFRKRRKKLV